MEITYVLVDSHRANEMLYKHLEDYKYGYVDPSFDMEYPLAPDYNVPYKKPMSFAIIYDDRYSTAGHNPDRFNQLTYDCRKHEKHITVAEFLWDKLEDVIVDDNGNIESDWNIFEAGTDIEYIWKFLEEELGVSVAKLMEGPVPISIKESNRTYYTLRRGNATEEDILKDADGNIKEFTTYEEAFDQMVNIYTHSLYGKHYTYADTPVRYKIWRTQVSYYEGKESSMTMQV